MDHAALLVSPIGEDSLGRFLFHKTQELGMRTDGLVSCGGGSAVCNMVLNPSGGLVGGVADMDIVESFTVDVVSIQHFQWGDVYALLMI
jgi:pseudouridylate synthase / pseudouridine kinase